jgi:hypothetical protein
MDKYNNEKMLEALNLLGVPEDLPEVALSGEPAPPADALGRIKQRTMQKITVSKGQARSRKPAVFARWLKVSVAAAMVVAFIAASWVGPAHVWAGLQKALSLVPGFGLFDQEASEFTLIAAERVRVSHQGGFIEVSGILAQRQSTFVSIYFNQVPGINEMPENKDIKPEEDEASYQEKKDKVMQIFLLDEAGRDYRYNKNSGFGWAGSEKDSHLSLQLPPLAEEVRLVTLVIPLEAGEEVKIPVPLASLAEVSEWAEMSNAVTARGITVSAAAHFTAGSDTRISLFVIPPESSRRIEEIGRYFGGNISASLPVALAGDRGGSYEFLRYGQTGWQANYYELYFEEVDPAEKEVTFSIPILLFRDEGKARVTVPVPTEGSLELNQDLVLGRFSLTLSRAEVVHYPHGDTLRVYVDLGPVGEETLEGFALDIRNGSWGGKYNEVTGQLEYFEVGLDGNSRNMKFTLKDPVYSIEGPWDITFPRE